MARNVDDKDFKIESEGVYYGTPPIFCEQCPDLAMAVVEGSALCRTCTMREIQGRAAGWIAENARPLLVRSQS